MKWKLYWAALVAALLGVCYFKNTRNYRNKTTTWKAGKSLIECGLLVLAAAFAPILLAIYGSMLITQKIQRPAIRVGVGFLTGIGLTLLLSSFLELVVLLGVFSIELLSGDFLGYWQERRDKRLERVA
ncbi:MAG: hypothetical protein WA766_03135 [Candidatus Acidiferrales bacterium]